MDNVVGFLGYECEDIAIYLAKMLRVLGKNTVIVDRTEQELVCEMFEMSAENEKNRKEGEYSGFTITNRTVCYEEYDFVFYLFGYRLNHPKLYECGKMIMVTDGVPAHVTLLKQIEHWECKSYLIIRNLVSMKHTETYLASIVNKENDFFLIPLDERDVRTKCNLGPYTGCEIRRLSAGMKEVLLKMICNFISDYAEKDIRKQMKKI